MQAKPIPPKNDPVLPGSFTIEQFCVRHSISRTLFRMMRARGEGPKVMRCGRAVRISLEAERLWVEQRESAQVESPVAEARSQASRKGGLAGLTSDRHGSKRPDRKKVGV